MTAGLMAGKIGVITALGPVTGLTWRESLVTGAFLAQGGEFAFVIFGQATNVGAGFCSRRTWTSCSWWW